MKGVSSRGLRVENLRHLAALFRQGGRPAATVYDSLGPDFFLAPAPGWLGDVAQLKQQIERAVFQSGH